MAENIDVVDKPRDWGKAVSVSYLRLIGQTQELAAKGAGIGVRTLRRYELSKWWPEACREAVDRWMQQLAIECRTTIMAAVKAGDVVTGGMATVYLPADLKHNHKVALKAGASIMRTRAI